MTRKEAIKALEHEREWIRTKISCSPTLGSPMQYKIIDAINMAIEALQERPKGRWIDTGYKNSTGNIYKCSNCEGFHNPNEEDIKLNRVKEKPNFCPNCGADMKGE